jgi:hypothetical protein
MKIAARKSPALKQKRIVSGGVHFMFNETAHKIERVARRANDLWRTTQRIGILHAPARIHQGAPLCERAHVSGHRLLPGVAAGGMQARVKGRRCAQQGFQA